MSPQFRRRPQRYRHSFAYFRTPAIITALQRDLGVRYNPAKIPDDAPTDPTNATDPLGTMQRGTVGLKAT